MIKIAPSVLAAAPMRMGAEVTRMARAGADWIHVDIMDGNFVPNLSYGPSLVKALKKETALPLDVHLMILHPEKFIETFAKAGADILTVHQEVESPLPGLISAIHRAGVQAGVSVKPATKAETLAPYLNDIDLVLIMTVEPGFGGQAFMPEMIEKIRVLRRMGYQGVIEVDGGVGPDNAGLLMESGATALVMGTALFTSPDPKGAIEMIRAMEKGHEAKSHG
jgi:ribulose-phosphate 3-epimerase